MISGFFTPNDSLHQQMNNNLANSLSSKMNSNKNNSIDYNQPSAVLSTLSGLESSSTTTTMGINSGNCGQCHQTTQWKPATFNHNNYFLLDGDHNTTCSTCHVQNNYRQYTCYGCHEHNKANVWLEHREEGVQNIDNCVKCHRSSSEGGEGWCESGGESNREGDDD